MKSIIVDDAMFMRAMIRRILESNGVEVVGEGANGMEAVKLYKNLQPDIITLDITMPEMDGIQAVKEIIKVDSNAKIIMISAMNQEHLVREAIMNGAKHFIVKPFKEDKIISVIQKITSM